MILFMLGMLAGTCVALGIWAWQEADEPERVYARPEVLAFANVMEAKLKENDFKGGWQGENNQWIVEKLAEEVGELKDELAKDSPLASRVVAEAADVANIAMFAADNNGVLVS